jgi:hypothetical protein
VKSRLISKTANEPTKREKYHSLQLSNRRTSEIKLVVFLSLLLCAFLCSFDQVLKELEKRKKKKRKKRKENE